MAYRFADIDQRVKTVTTRCPSTTDKPEALAFVCRQVDITPDQRETVWRFWCKSTGTAVLRGELARVRAPKARDQQTGLF